MSKDAFNLMMADLTPLFKRVVDTNCLVQSSSEFLIRDPENIATKGWLRERRIKSGVEKKSKKAVNMTFDVSSTKGNDKRPAKRKRMTPLEVVEVVQ